MKTSLTLLVLCLILTGCNNRTQEIFLNRSECAAPCWYNLSPGKTTSVESQTILASLPFVSAQSLKTDSGYFFWRFTSEASGQGRLYFGADGKLQKIALNPDSLILGSVIDFFGPPEHAWAYYLPGDGIAYASTLYYPTQGIIVDVRDKPRNTIGTGGLESITRDLRISEIKFFAPTSIERVLGTIETWSPDNVSHIESRLKSWPGFDENVIQIEPQGGSAANQNP